MGTNTKNGIRIFSITIRIYSKYSFWEIMALLVWEIVSLSWHRTYPDTATVHDQAKVGKSGLGFL